MKAQQRAAEKEIRDYAESLVRDYIKAEYELQINKWKVAINLVADAHKMAFEAHRSVLEEIDRQRQARWELAMLALSLVAGPALSWLSAAIQYKGVPKWLGKNRVMAETATIQRVNTQTMHINKFNLNSLWGRKESIKLITSSRDYSKVQAKIIGDLAKSLASEALDASLSNTKPQSSGNIDAQLENLVRDDGDPDKSFKTRLENALLVQSNVVIKGLMNQAMTIKHTVKFGRQWLKVVSSESPRAPLDRQVRVAKFEIRQWLNDERAKWAKEWFYYGHSPSTPSVKQMSRIIEREIWALWILEQGFKWNAPVVAVRTPGFGGSPGSTGKGSINRPFHPLILDRLAELEVLPARNAVQAARRAKRETEARLQGQTVRGIPVTGVEGTIDTGRELQAVNRWARNHRPESLSGDIGPLRATPRVLPSVERIFNSH